MKRVRELCAEPLVVSTTLGVRELAQFLLDNNADGACVVDDGEIVGVVTSMDLVFQEKRIHLPTFVAVLDGFLPTDLLGNRTRVELDKVTGTTVGEIMTSPPITVNPETPITEAATLMVERHLTLLPVVDGMAVVGALTKRDLLRYFVAR